MALYHVLVTTSDKPESFRCILFDLSDDDLKQNFLRPYKRAKSILCGDEVIESRAIKRLKIVRTAASSATELKQLQEKSVREIQEFNRSSESVVLISPGRGHNIEDITDVGEDVTARYVLAPPGEGDAWVVAMSFLNSGWVVAIGGGVVVAALAWWFGWN